MSLAHSLTLLKKSSINFDQRWLAKRVCVCACVHVCNTSVSFYHRRSTRREHFREFPCWAPSCSCENYPCRLCIGHETQWSCKKGRRNGLRAKHAHTSINALMHLSAWTCLCDLLWHCREFQTCLASTCWNSHESAKGQQPITVRIVHNVYVPFSLK